MSMVGRRRAAEEMRLADGERQNGEAKDRAGQEMAGPGRFSASGSRATQEATRPSDPPVEAARQSQQFKVIRRLRRGRWTLTEVPA